MEAYIAPVLCALSWFVDRFLLPQVLRKHPYADLPLTPYQQLLEKFHRHASKGFLLATSIAALWARPLTEFLVDYISLCVLTPAMFFLLNNHMKILSLYSMLGTFVLFYWGQCVYGAGVASSFLTVAAIVSFPKSFTFGEAWVLSRGLVAAGMFAWTSHDTNTIPERFVAVCVVGAVVVYVGGRLSLWLAGNRWPILSGSIGVVVVGFGAVLPSLSSVLHENVLDWFFLFVHHHFHTLGISLSLTIACIAFISMTQTISSANLRKAFHGLVVFLFVPLLYVDVRFLYYSLAFVFVLFVLAEFYRLSNAKPLSKWIDGVTARYVDVQDSGPLILTPIYLLLGIAIPIWLSSGGGGEGRSAVSTVHTTTQVGAHAHTIQMSTFAGLMSIGIGDTFAALVGRRFGRVYILFGNKTLEGLLGSIASQLVFAYILMQLGVVEVEHGKLILCVVVNACVEATTSQIDNFLIPILSYQLLTL
eukprot:m.30738 g.30738  ORF g.30738 m.30738 type:complete len:475 (+) comp9658_c0_seq1:55-1479(+)